MAIVATGKIAKYQFTMGMVSMSTIFLIWGLVAAGLGAFGVGISFIISLCSLTLLRVWFAKYLAGISIRYWSRRVLLPVLISACMAFGAGALIIFCMPISFLRLCCTTVATSGITAAMAWFLVMDCEERAYVWKTIMRLTTRTFTGLGRCVSILARH